MPRNSRRLVRTLKIVGGDDGIEVRVGGDIVHEDQVLRRPRIASAEMRVDPALPVGMAQARRAGREHELSRHEVVVGDNVGGEMAQVPEAERAQRVRGRAVVDLLSHMPEMTVTAERGVLLRDGGVGGDVAVQEVVRVRTQQVGDGDWKQVQVGEERFTQVDMRAGCPRPRRLREDEKGDPDDDEAAEEPPKRHRLAPTPRKRRATRITGLPRSVRTVDATSIAASSTSPATTS
jgi:hypothetical protein